MYGSAADAKLDAMHDQRERDPLPDETPPTAEELEAMHRYFESLDAIRKQAFADFVQRIVNHGQTGNE